MYISSDKSARHYFEEALMHMTGIFFHHAPLLKFLLGSLVSTHEQLTLVQELAERYKSRLIENCVFETYLVNQNFVG